MNQLKCLVIRIAINSIKKYDKITWSLIEMIREQDSQNLRSTVKPNRNPMKINRNPFNMNEKTC